MGAFKVENVKVWSEGCSGAEGLDSAGIPIRRVYYKVDQVYAVYRTDDRVMVQYADADALATQQRQALRDLYPPRGEINALIDGWRQSGNPDSVERAQIFDQRVADALQVALQGDAAQGLALLSQVKVDLVAERTSIARTSYLGVAAMVTVFAMAAFWLLWQFDGAGLSKDIWFAAGVGSIGAFFSTAIALRSRQIGIDLQWRDNYIDAALRIVIGAISAVVLYCMMAGRLIDFSLGQAKTSDVLKLYVDSYRAFAIIIAFLAGFSERLVGDLLNKSADAIASKGGNPLTGGSAPTALPPPPVANADETNPLGKPADPKVVIVGPVPEPPAPEPPAPEPPTPEPAVPAQPVTEEPAPAAQNDTPPETPTDTPAAVEAEPGPIDTPQSSEKEEAKPEGDQPDEAEGADTTAGDAGTPPDTDATPSDGDAPSEAPPVPPPGSNNGG